MKVYLIGTLKSIRIFINLTYSIFIQYNTSMPVENPSNQEERVRELPQPYKGVTEEVFSDLLSDRANFVKKAFTNLLDENPQIAKLIIKDCITSLDPESSLNFALSYYEIFSRSARKNGQRLLMVTEDTFQSDISVQQRDLESIMNSPTDISNYFEEQEKQKQQQISNEINQNAELGEFWVTLKMWAVHQHIGGKKQIETELILISLYAVRSLLYNQQAANRLRNQFSAS